MFRTVTFVLTGLIVAQGVMLGGCTVRVDEKPSDTPSVDVDVDRPPAKVDVDVNVQPKPNP